MLMTPYARAVWGLSSTFSFTAIIFDEYCRAISSTTGDTMWHGTHHSAQKSTRTGTFDCSTEVSKSWSVTSFTLLLICVPPRRGTRPVLAPKHRIAPNHQVEHPSGVAYF